MTGAATAGRLPNVFAEIGIGGAEAAARAEADFETLFFGAEGTRIYHEAEGGTGYLVDTGNNDVRTEGQSYGMMIAVQMDRRDVFDRVWRWTKRHMLLTEGRDAGYFGWSAKLSGELNSCGPAPDGEEFFAMALFFAARRWNDEAYADDAKAIVRAMIHNENPMFHPGNRLIKFTPVSDFSDPSYHLPHFYELFAEYGDGADAAFCREAAAASREYLQKAIHPVTGLNPEYAEFDGAPKNVRNHHLFYSDAYRTIANVALDALWFGRRDWQRDRANAIQAFFGEADRGGAVFRIDGTPAGPEEQVAEIDGRPGGVLHPVGLLATLAQASLAADGPHRPAFVKKLWETPLREGNRRYYDNLLYMFALMALGGGYRVW